MFVIVRKGHFVEKKKGIIGTFFSVIGTFLRIASKHNRREKTRLIPTSKWCGAINITTAQVVL